MKKEELVKLFEAMEMAAKNLEGIASINTHGKSAEDRVDIDIAFKRAKAENDKASWAYTEALKQVT